MITITNEQKVNVHVTAVTEANLPITLNVVPTWAVVSGDVSLEVAEDGLSAFVVSGSVGASQVKVSATINDSLEISNTLDVEVVTATASSFTFLTDAPVLK